MEARRKLVEAVRERYRKAERIEKKQILDEFAEMAGYNRKYAIRVLRRECEIRHPSQRLRGRIYEEAVITALTMIWEAADRICGKRLKAVLSTFVESMESHGHLCLDEEVRKRLLGMSASTIDRVLRPVRAIAKRGRRRAFLTTPLRKAIAIRTFNDWNDPPPGYFEMDMVAHCGNSVSGNHVHSLVLTDVASGWTEAAAMIVREQTLVIVTLDEIRPRLPFRLLGLDVDNDSAFINETVLNYCRIHGLELTRSRAYKKNDQAWIEQKNGAVIRKLVGYSRLEGAQAAVILAQLHRLARLYVNFFQPSFKLKSKMREGGKVVKKYHAPATPCEQLLADERVDLIIKQQLREQFATLDPVQLLNQIRRAQQDIAALSSGAAAQQPNEQTVQLDEFVRSLATAWRQGEVRAPYKKRRADAKPHTWRTRPDPFEDVWPMVLEWLNDEPSTTAKDLFLRLNTQPSERFKPSQLRTLQRRVKEWRTAIARRVVLGCNYDTDSQGGPYRINTESIKEETIT